MINSAKTIIRFLFNTVEDSLESRDNINGLQKITEVKLNVYEAMKKNNDLNKWNLFKDTDEFTTIKLSFESIFMDDYPEIIIAYRIFMNPCLIKKLA